MPRVFHNIEQQLLPALQETLGLSQRSDFCVGYFNLRGWKQIDSYVDRWAGGWGHGSRLAQHYGFMEEELDFIINYDIKYRMERDEETAEESLNG